MNIVWEIVELGSKLKFMTKVGVAKLLIQLLCMILTTLTLGVVLGIISKGFIIFTLITSIVYLVSMVIQKLLEI